MPAIPIILLPNCLFSDLLTLHSIWNASCNSNRFWPPFAVFLRSFFSLFILLISPYILDINKETRHTQIHLLHISMFACIPLFFFFARGFVYYLSNQTTKWQIFLLLGLSICQFVTVSLLFT